MQYMECVDSFLFILSIWTISDSILLVQPDVFEPSIFDVKYTESAIVLRSLLHFHPRMCAAVSLMPPQHLSTQAANSDISPPCWHTHQ